MKAEMLAQTQKHRRGWEMVVEMDPSHSSFMDIYGSPLSSSSWSKAGKHGKKYQEPPERKKKRKEKEEKKKKSSQTENTTHLQEEDGTRPSSSDCQTRHNWTGMKKTKKIIP